MGRKRQHSVYYIKSYGKGIILHVNVLIKNTYELIRLYQQNICILHGSETVSNWPCDYYHEQTKRVIQDPRVHMGQPGSLRRRKMQSVFINTAHTIMLMWLYVFIFGASLNFKSEHRENRSLYQHQTMIKICFATGTEDWNKLLHKLWIKIYNRFNVSLKSIL